MGARLVCWIFDFVLHFGWAAHTHPVFPMEGPAGDQPPDCKAWTCLEYVDPEDPTMTCCLPRMSVWEAISMLNGEAAAISFNPPPPIDCTHAVGLAGQRALPSVVSWNVPSRT